MTYILAIAGKKQAGKTTAARYLVDNAVHLLRTPQPQETLADVYSFAGPMKLLCMEYFGLTREQCWGTEEQKNSLTNLYWEKLPYPTPTGKLTVEGTWCANFYRCGPMTAREVLQHVGTGIFRKMNENIWVKKCLRNIEIDNPALAVIDDCRFANEVKGMQDAGGKVILLTRNVHNDSHESENSLPAHSTFDAVIHNDIFSITDCHKQLLSYLQDWGWAY